MVGRLYGLHCVPARQAYSQGNIRRGYKAAAAAGPLAECLTQWFVERHPRRLGGKLSRRLIAGILDEAGSAQGKKTAGEKGHVQSAAAPEAETSHVEDHSCWGPLPIACSVAAGRLQLLAEEWEAHLYRAIDFAGKQEGLH